MYLTMFLPILMKFDAGREKFEKRKKNKGNHVKLRIVE